MEAIGRREAETLPQSMQAGVETFVFKTYCCLFSALAAMTLCGLVSYRSLPPNWRDGLATADGILWVLCTWVQWRSPMSLVFPLFVLINGLTAGQLALLYPTVFFAATIFTLLAFAALSLFILVSGVHFSPLYGFFTVACIVLAAGVVLSRHYHQHSVLYGWTGFVVVGISCLILYDTGQIIENADDDLTPGKAAFELIIDLVLMHRWMLDYLQDWYGSDEH